MWVLYNREEWLFACCVLSFGWCHDVWILYADISEYPVRTHDQWRWEACSERSAHKIQTPKNRSKERTKHSHTAKVWNQDAVFESISIDQNIKDGNIIYNCYWQEVFKWRKLRPFTFDVHTLCRWTSNLLLTSGTEIRLSGCWEVYFRLNRQNTRMTKLK